MARHTEIYLPPSGAKTWTSCTEQPWFLLEHQDELPKNLDTDQSIEGTLAHDYAAHQLLDKPWKGQKVSKKIRDGVHGYVNFINSLRTCEPYGTEVLSGVEYRVPPFYAPKRNAYIDFFNVVVTEEDSAIVSVCDYKNGRWPVDVKHNKQLAIYGRSLIDTITTHPAVRNLLDVNIHFHLYIYQPNLDDDEESSVRGPWVLTMRELIEWTGEHIGSFVEMIRARKGTKFEPNDDNCHFCPANKAMLCTARNEQSFAGGSEQLLSVEEVAPVLGPALDPKKLPKDKLLAMLPYVDDLKKYCDGIKEAARQLAEAGKLTIEDGYKLVKGKGSRHWIDEDKAREHLSAVFDEDTVAPRELLSPKQAEDLMKENDMPHKTIGYLIERTEGRPLLVPAEDPREQLQTHGLTNEDFELLRDVS